jgi:hypothetical protein
MLGREVPPPCSRGVGASPGVGVASVRRGAVAVLRNAPLGLTELLPALLGGQGRDTCAAQVPSDLHAMRDHDQHMIPAAC